ncbi:hypothetical protein FNV43_RR06521 [Rhamnella rubrinervis]|uniref:Uncharacterized protein n=1 Tax=Rhamnella rubrinervis TaxID=2594499 RepID=A0A8K0MLH1_9ROSA|nr:hypothetical protein FNV43_RR06521 [Rhamnella rubrinervis]
MATCIRDFVVVICEVLSSPWVVQSWIAKRLLCSESEVVMEALDRSWRLIELTWFARGSNGGWVVGLLVLARVPWRSWRLEPLGQSNSGHLFCAHRGRIMTSFREFLLVRDYWIGIEFHWESILIFVVSLIATIYFDCNCAGRTGRFWGLIWITLCGLEMLGDGITKIDCEHPVAKTNKIVLTKGDKPWKHDDLYMKLEYLEIGKMEVNLIKAGIFSSNFGHFARVLIDVDFAGFVPKLYYWKPRILVKFIHFEYFLEFCNSATILGIRWRSWALAKPRKGPVKQSKATQDTSLLTRYLISIDDLDDLDDARRGFT